MAVSHITFYSKKNCSQCSITARVMASNGLTGIEGAGINVTPAQLPEGPPVVVVKVDEDPEALARLKERGYASVPVVDFHHPDGGITTVAGADVEQIASLAQKES